MACYPRLANAEAALHELQDAAIMGAQAAHDCPHAGACDQSAICWSLTVMLDGPASERADPILRQHAPRALSRQHTPARAQQN